MANKLKYRNVKIASFTSPQSKTKIFERYVLENEDDLKKLVKVMPEIKRISLDDTLRTYILKGKIPLVTDLNLTGYPSWCLENTNPDNHHPSTFNRVK